MGGPGAAVGSVGVPMVGGPASMTGLGGNVPTSAVVGVPRPLSPGLNYGER